PYSVAGCFTSSKIALPCRLQSNLGGLPVALRSLREVLQLCSHPVVGWLDAPPGVFGLQSIQMAPIRAGGHPYGSGMVFALLAFVPRRRGAIGRAWALGGSRHRLAQGPAVRPGVGSAPAQTTQGNKRLLAGGRDVRPGQRQMGVLVPGLGLDRCDDRLPSLGQTRCS